MSADFRFVNHGSLWLMQPQNGDAVEWVRQHVAEDAQHFGGGIVVEARYVQAMVEGIQRDGLKVEGA